MWPMVYDPSKDPDIVRFLEAHTQFAEHYRQLQEAAKTDLVTGLPNRRRFEEELRKKWEEIERYDRDLRLSIAFADIDNFKAYNTERGQREGDRVLFYVSRAMENVMRKHDLLARYGGEEFVALLFMADKQTGLYIAKRMRRNVELLGFGPTVTIGVATYPTDPAETPDELIHMADRTMRAGKNAGKNRVLCYNPKLTVGIE